VKITVSMPSGPPLPGTEPSVFSVIMYPARGRADAAAGVTGPASSPVTLTVPAVSDGLGEGAAACVGGGVV
jgi:hypothetical protein